MFINNGIIKNNIIYFFFYFLGYHALIVLRQNFIFTKQVYNSTFISRDIIVVKSTRRRSGGAAEHAQI